MKNLITEAGVFLLCFFAIYILVLLVKLSYYAFSMWLCVVADITLLCLFVVVIDYIVKRIDKISKKDDKNF